MKQSRAGFSIVIVAAGLLLCGAQTKAYAASVETFTSLQAWQAAVKGSPQFFTNLQSFTKNTYFQTVPVYAGPFSLQQNGYDSVFGYFENFIDVPPLQFTDNSGVTNAALYTKSGLVTVNMTFSPPVFAWGAYFYGAQTSELENLVLTASGGGVIATVPVTVNTGFFGFVISPSEAVSEITFESQIDNPNPSVGQGFGLENVTGAYISLPTLSAGTACNGAFSGAFTGTITVSAGQNCTFLNGSITGSVTVEGGNLVLTGDLVSGSVEIIEGGTFSIGPSTTIKGGLLAFDLPAGTTQSQVCGSTVKGSVDLLDVGEPVQIGSSSSACAGNVIGGSVTVSANAGSIAIFDNTITDALQCTGNSSITGGGNTAEEKEGQCASF